MNVNKAIVGHWSVRAEAEIMHVTHPGTSSVLFLKLQSFLPTSFHFLLLFAETACMTEVWLTFVLSFEAPPHLLAEFIIFVPYFRLHPNSREYRLCAFVAAEVATPCACQSLIVRVTAYIHHTCLS